MQVEGSVEQVSLQPVVTSRQFTYRFVDQEELKTRRLSAPDKEFEQ